MHAGSRPNSNETRRRNLIERSNPCVKGSFENSTRQEKRAARQEIVPANVDSGKDYARFAVSVNRTRNRVNQNSFSERCRGLLGKAEIMQKKGSSIGMCEAWRPTETSPRQRRNDSENPRPLHSQDERAKAMRTTPQSRSAVFLRVPRFAA